LLWSYRSIKKSQIYGARLKSHKSTLFRCQFIKVHCWPWWPYAFLLILTFRIDWNTCGSHRKPPLMHNYFSQLRNLLITSQKSRIYAIQLIQSSLLAVVTICYYANIDLPDRLEDLWKLLLVKFTHCIAQNARETSDGARRRRRLSWSHPNGDCCIKNCD